MHWLVKEWWVGMREDLILSRVQAGSGQLTPQGFDWRKAEMCAGFWAHLAWTSNGVQGATAGMAILRRESWGNRDGWAHGGGPVQELTYRTLNLRRHCLEVLLEDCFHHLLMAQLPLPSFPGSMPASSTRPWWNHPPQVLHTGATSSYVFKLYLFFFFLS